MTCAHSNASDLQPPRSSESVYREDCTQCFDSIDDESGLNRDEPPPKISKLAISAETEEDRYDIATSVVCYSCNQQNVDKTSGNLPAVINGVMTAMTFSKKEEVKAWEQEFIPCKHTLCLAQQEVENAESKDSSKCSSCDLKENLWICLECGNIGCGRSQFGGTQGNSHALAHADGSSHAVAVKLGSITAEGSADIYCYTCNEERIDPELANHLAHWGIFLAGREKTEKSLMEMQVEHNLQWEFSMTTEDGRELTPLFGPGLTGLANLGNSCYLSSIMQCIFSVVGFQNRYYRPLEEPPLCQTPGQDLETQLRKLADGLISGRYSRPDSRLRAAASDASEVAHQKGLAPAMFKYLIGQGHEEFSTMRQQDAFEFLLHVFKSVSISKHPDNEINPVHQFRFEVEQRLQCLSCKRVRYKVDEQDNISLAVPARRIPEKPDQFEAVTLSECLDIFTGAEVVELSCPGCNSREGFTKRTLFKTLPQELAINARRFALVNWVPTKLDIPLIVNDGPVDFGPYLAGEHDADEELLPEAEDASPAFEPNSGIMDQLLGMGFPATRCEKALYATDNSDSEAAMNWLFAHMEDPDIDEPLVLKKSAGEPMVTEQDQAKISQLGEMGIEPARAQKALSATDGDVNRALDWVFSHPDDDAAQDNSNGNQTQQDPFGYSTLPAQYQLRSIVCHKGTSVHAGHYVAVIRKALPDQADQFWVMFNDEKVVKFEDLEPMKSSAYVYFFTRV
ncbi:hypothetical protein N7540_011923 [Penicillium herquei]|nr:hypothetical protein N7540_011923 [Penicillium herquei]